MSAHTKPPKGYRVTTNAIKIPYSKYPMHDCKVWKGTQCILTTSGTMFHTSQQARECGISRAWDIYFGRTSWS